MIVQYAVKEDIEAWLELASDVESLFGPMVKDPKFLDALQKNIRRKSAYCIRENDGLPGSPLLGGLLFSSSTDSNYNIGWLAVTSKVRGNGVATSLVKQMLALIQSPAEVTVTTFGADIEGGLPARKFYLKHGFIPENMIANGPEGGSRQRFRLFIR